MRYLFTQDIPKTLAESTTNYKMALNNGMEFNAVGSTWIAEYHNFEWPVVLCDQETAPPAFMSSRTAADHLPAILLGRHKYIWVHGKDLQDWNPNRNYLEGLKPFEQPDIQKDDDPAVIIEKQRRTAFNQDVHLMENHKYWHNYIMNQSEARKLEKVRRNKGFSSSWSSSKNRASGPERSTSWPSGGVHTKKDHFSTGTDGEEPFSQSQRLFEGDPGPRPMRDTPTRPKRNESERSSTTLGRSLASRQTGNTPIRPKRNESERSSTTLGRSLASRQTMDRKRNSPEEASPLSRKNRRVMRPKPIIIDLDSEIGRDSDVMIIGDTTLPGISPPSSSQYSEDANPGQVKLLFRAGGVETSILIPRLSLRSCNYLFHRENYSAKHASHIIPLWSDPRAITRKLTEKEMRRLIPYFETGDLVPAFLGTHSNKHLASRMSSALKGEFAETLGLAFVTASKISHIKLEELIIKKLKALYPLPGITLLALVVMFASIPDPETSVEEEVVDWLVDHLVESYGKLMEEHVESFKKLLDEHPGLKKVVEARLKLAASEEKEEDGCQDEVVPARAGQGVKGL